MSCSLEVARAAMVRRQPVAPMVRRAVELGTLTALQKKLYPLMANSSPTLARVFLLQNSEVWFDSSSYRSLFSICFYETSPWKQNCLSISFYPLRFTKRISKRPGCTFLRPCHNISHFKGPKQKRIKQHWSQARTGLFPNLFSTFSSGTSKGAEIILRFLFKSECSRSGFILIEGLYLLWTSKHRRSLTAQWRNVSMDHPCNEMFSISRNITSRQNWQSSL